VDSGRADSERPEAVSGFTLIEIIAVLVILGILCLYALVRYNSLVDASRRKAASSLLASAQSQLSLEFSRRLLDNLDMNVAPQNVCDNVSVSTAGVATTLICSGDLAANVAITATVDGESVNTAWRSPLGN